MWMKRSAVARKACPCAFDFQGLGQFSQVARRVVDSHPKNVWLPDRGESATATNLDFKRWHMVGCCFQGVRKRFGSRNRYLAQKLQCQVKVFFAGPTGACIRKFAAESTAVLAYLSPNIIGKFEKLGDNWDWSASVSLALLRTRLLMMASETLALQSGMLTPCRAS